MPSLALHSYSGLLALFSIYTAPQRHLPPYSASMLPWHIAAANTFSLRKKEFFLEKEIIE